MKNKIFAVIGIIFLIWLVFFSPPEKSEGDFTKILYAWGDRQEEASEKVTSAIVAGAEGGSFIGEHQVNGANWSIPNIVRRVLGVS